MYERVTLDSVLVVTVRSAHLRVPVGCYLRSHSRRAVSPVQEEALLVGLIP